MYCTCICTNTWVALSNICVTAVNIRNVFYYKIYGICSLSTAGTFTFDWLEISGEGSWRWTFYKELVVFRLTEGRIELPIIGYLSLLGIGLCVCVCVCVFSLSLSHKHTHTSLWKVGINIISTQTVFMLIKRSPFFNFRCYLSQIPLSEISSSIIS